MPTDLNKMAKILACLQDTYPHVKTQLTHDNAFQLLIATILSAQCTDKQVNAVTPSLFGLFPTPEALANAPIHQIEEIIHSTGFFHTKARRIIDCAQTLVKKHDATVPQDMKTLLSLPGVGRKTANVVLNAAFEIPGVVVDTHVARLSRRFGFTKEKNPEKIEFDLMKLLPEKVWIDYSLLCIYHGRALCTARKPKCEICPVSPWCAYHTNELTNT